MANLPTTGIDISEFNGDVDIAALKGQIDFIIIRCGYGSNYEDQDDTQYEANVRKCEAAGIPYGVYLYSYAKNTDMARSEAAHALCPRARPSSITVLPSAPNWNRRGIIAASIRSCTGCRHV